jgi:hypothetical protein
MAALFILYLSSGLDSDMGKYEIDIFDAQFLALSTKQDCIFRHGASVGWLTFCVFPMFIFWICDRDANGNKGK